MDFRLALKSFVMAAALLAVSYAYGQDADSCRVDAACISSCGRFDAGDARLNACENVCRRNAGQGSSACGGMAQPALPHQSSTPEVRTYSKKGDALRERELNGKMARAVASRDLRDIRRLIEGKHALNPTFVYDFDYNPQTRLHEGRAVRLRLTDIFNDVVMTRGDEEGLDKVLELFIELGLDVTATLPQTHTGDTASTTIAPQTLRTAWGPNLKFIEPARDRASRMRAFELALEKGLKPNDDVGEWLFAELPEVCGRDRSEFAIQTVDLLIEHLGTSLQDDFWRIGERGPETVSDVLDRLMSPGRTPRSNSERAQFAMMDSVWENCAPLSRRINRYLTQGN
jgi:hypothetical protein